MDAVQQLIEIEAIRRLKARYFRCMDIQDTDGWLDVFTDDIVLTFDLAISTGGRDGDPTVLSGKEALGFVPKNHIGAQTLHHGHMPEIDILSETEARGIWAMEDVVDKGHSVIRGAGHYHETYRKEADGKWRIATVHLTRLRVSKFDRDNIRL